MIRVEKDFTNPPVKLTTDERTRLIQLTLSEKGNHEFKKKVYRDSVYDELVVLYHGKCAYCETDTRAGAPMQVEHYRPKAKVTEDNLHEGYYWIGYEWSNLFLSCSKCNNKKRNSFPVSGMRVMSPNFTQEGLLDVDSSIANSQVFQQEQALLLHPEIDEAERLFIFLPNGRVDAANQNLRAIKTIEICDLNRKDLVEKRLKILNYFFDQLQTELRDLEMQKITEEKARHAIKRLFEKLALLQNPKNEYSRFGYFMFVKFDKFFSERLPTKQGNAAKRLFEQFRTGQL